MSNFKLTAIGFAALLFCSASQAAPLAVKLSAFAGESIELVVNQIDDDYYVNVADLSGFSKLKISDVSHENGVVKLSEIGDVDFDELTSTMRIRFDTKLLVPQIIGLVSDFRIPIDAPLQHAVLVDYNLRGEIQSNGESKMGGLVSASTWVGLSRFDAAGVVDKESKNSQVTQLRMSRENHADSSLLEGGSIIGKGGSRGAPLAILGLGISKNRSVTPGFITGPRLRVDGVASTRSTVDVLLQNHAATASKSIEPGPFSVIALPSVDGTKASVVVKDELGIETIVTSDLFANPSLLGIGQSEYSVSAGGIQAFGLKTAGAAAQGYYRLGVTNYLTMEIGAQAKRSGAQKSESHLNLAADLATVLGDFSVDVQGLDRPLLSSMTYNAPAMRLGAWRFFASGSATFKRVSQVERRDSTEESSSKVLTVRASSGALSMYATSITTNTSALHIAGANYRFKSIAATLQAGVSRFKPDHGKATSSASVSLSFPFGGSSYSSGLQSTDAGLRKRLAGNTSISNGYNVGASIEGVHDVDLAQLNGFAQLPVANAQITLQKTPEKASARGSLRGSLLVYDSNIMAMKSSANDGFAVFDLGAAGVKVRGGFEQSVSTNTNGLAVVSIPALRNVNLRIDPETAPDGLDLTSALSNVRRRGGVLVSRRAVTGQFFEFDQADIGSSLIINEIQYPITDRGAWVELPAGSHTGKIGDRLVEIVMESPSSKQQM